MSADGIDLKGEARVWIGPRDSRLLERAVTAGGGQLVNREQANVFVLHGAGEGELGLAEELAELLHDAVAVVQLPSAGVESLVGRGLIDDGRLWLSAAGAYADPVAEHAMALLLALIKRLPEMARAKGWSDIHGNSLAASTIGIHGAGGIGRRLIELLAPFGCRVLAVNRSGEPVPGVERVIAASNHLELFRESDAVVLCAPLTEQTQNLVGDEELTALGPNGVLINVGRGGLVDQDALVRALRAGGIAGAALDVTTPEPLPGDHPLWQFSNVLITPHVANPHSNYEAALARRIEENVGRLSRGEAPVGEVKPERGY